MASILFIVSSEEIKRTVQKTIEAHKRYYEKNTGTKGYARVDIIVELDGDAVDLGAFNPDIIVARGITAIQLKKKNPTIPIVEIPITAIDVIAAIHEFNDMDIVGKRIALIGFGNSQNHADIAGKILNLNIIPFDIYRESLDEATLSSLMDKVVKEDIRHIVGGVRTIQAAKAKNLSTAFLSSSQESIWLALTEAQHISVIHRMERERAARFETILDHSHEGIITTDRSNRIIQINAAARKTLSLGTAAYIDKPIDDAINERTFRELITDEKDRSDELIKIGRKKIIIDKTGACLGGELIGNVITFQDITNVQDTEIKIRNKLHQRGLVAKYTFGDITGESPAIKKTIDNAKTFARTQSNMLILGDTGTGKELFAQSVHNQSERHHGPFVAVNCAAIPESLMESEFFGYAGGAFTDAAKEGRMGYFELAHGGTLFLDEVSEIPLNLQGKLLRVIQESEVMRIGHDTVIPLDLRIVCASNKDLKPLVKAGTFREDLYYRLAVMQLRIPPLRERGNDILLIADQFLTRTASDRTGKKIILETEARRLFLRHPWDGNIRELRNVCEQLIALNKTSIITGDEAAEIFSDTTIIQKTIAEIRAIDEPKSLSEDVRKIEKDHIKRALKKCGFKKTKAAGALGMDRSTLWRKMKEYGIELGIEG
ncbi:MAG: sigma 54-interacting transcriptional regulator [Treponemataceae bacterium]